MYFNLAGHVIFEMGSGVTLSGVLPKKSDYQMIPNESVREVLAFIFDPNTKFKKVI